MRLVTVKWIDALGGDGFIEKSDLEKQTPVSHNSVGYVVKETDSFITLTMSYNDDMDNLGAWMLIPKIMVVKITEL